MRKQDRKALGKGIGSLLPSRNTPATAPAAAPVVITTTVVNGVQTYPIEQVTPNPEQPRRAFDETALMELAQSIELDGIIQPLLVRRMAADQYQIIAGERRWRAAKLAGLKEVPAIVREADDEKVLELAIVENIQREDLNPIELALAFQRMAMELGLNHEQIGQKTGKQRVTITNSLRLLHLPEDVQELVSSHKLSSGHARALLKFEDDAVQREIAAKCVAEGWSVRQIEAFTKSTTLPGGKKEKAEEAPVDPNVKFAIDEMQRVLGTKVRIIEKGAKKGQIEIEFYSHDDLNRIYEAITQ